MMLQAVVPLCISSTSKAASGTSTPNFSEQITMSTDTSRTSAPLGFLLPVAESAVEAGLLPGDIESCRRLRPDRWP
jgi:hypothetical protein